MFPLLIISYDLFRKNLASLQSVCELLICDEGHRLKCSQGNKTIDSLSSLRCNRRIVLTGTPVQNDLEEFWALCNFVNPGCLGNLSSFRCIFASPILASREPSAAEDIKDLGLSRAAELSRVAESFILRRLSSTLSQYLPDKTESVVFCHLSENQRESYIKEAKSGVARLGESYSLGNVLSIIASLRRLCVQPHISEEIDTQSARKFTMDEATNSSKMQFLRLFVSRLTSTTNDRLVIVSNFTRNLDLCELVLDAQSIPYCRLDGSTPVQARTTMVETFNSSRTWTAFLLSSRAGGVGLNLIGANRLILLDPDWNPAIDKQAMARIWRDGQNKAVYIYRLLCTGTIEEKIVSALRISPAKLIQIYSCTCPV
uniref:DNA repair and recombination protein RAD54B n=1 Tax=Compsopogon caeruleus TaxID=31354 RepID=A0A7S1TGU5_9RHOD|mmetsp:Transcript_6885/g.14175  ORF Transcript_6885/g.14175 Transcript_6885/m.14175 type:complete len:371 (+) Transcript_6885:1010-2122(+)